MAKIIKFLTFLSIIFAQFFIPSWLHSQEWKWENPYPQGNNLYKIWVNSATDIFAVGDSGTIIHFDGVSWSVMLSNSTVRLEDVWGTSYIDVFAAGTAVLHFDGLSWSESLKPAPFVGFTS